MMMSKGWVNFKSPRAVHTAPVDDVVEHEESEDCVCRPTPCRVEIGADRGGGYGWQYTHHSLDGRELSEG